MFWLTVVLFFISFWLLTATVAFILWPAQAVLRQQLKFYEEKGQTQKASKFFVGQQRLLVFNFFKSWFFIRWLLQVKNIGQLLEQQFLAAGWKWQPADFVLWHFLTLVLVGSLTAAFSGLFLALLVVVFLALLPVFWLEVQKKQRREQFSRQLPETLSLLATSIKAGYGLMQAFSTVAQESADPMKSEIEMLLLSSRLGLNTDEALDRMAKRINYEPFSWIILAIKVQRQTGGNLAHILETTADTLRQRESARRQVKVLTAEGRLSAFILSSLPFVIIFALYFLNRQYVLTLFTAGKALFFVALLLILIGIAWFKKIVNLKE